MDTTRMRAVVVDDPGGGSRPRIAEVDAPVRRMSEVLVDVHAAGVGLVDVGARAADAGLPGIGGHDLAGRVAEAPYAMHDLQVGDAVFGIANPARGCGSFAERAAVSSLCLARKPAALTWEEAAAVPLASLTAWDAVVRLARAHGGQRVLVHDAASPAGHLAVQLARYFGARVVATASEASLDVLRELGADEVVDRDRLGAEDAVRKVDVVLDLAGDAGRPGEAADVVRWLDVLRPGGLLVVGRARLDPAVAAACAAAGMRATGLEVEPDGANLGIVGRLIEAGDLRVRVDAIHPLDDVAAAFERARSGHARGAVVLRMR